MLYAATVTLWATVTILAGPEGVTVGEDICMDLGVPLAGLALLKPKQARVISRGPVPPNRLTTLRAIHQPAVTIYPGTSGRGSAIGRKLALILQPKRWHKNQG